MDYILRLFRTKSFETKPFATLWRAMNWLLHVALRRKARIKVPIGDTFFLMELPPLLRRFGSTAIYVQRELYEPLLENLDRVVKSGDVVFDCGANQGIYTMAFGALVGSSGRVYAFEPQEYACACIRLNARLNGFAHVRVELVAVSSDVGEARIDMSRGSVLASIVRDFGGHRTETVKTITLDNFAERLDVSKVDVIKMDIEGAEYQALQGARGLIERYRPTIVLEATPEEQTWRDILSFLGSRGYRLHLFGKDGDLEPVRELTEFHPDVVFLVPRRE